MKEKLCYWLSEFDIGPDYKEFSSICYCSFLLASTNMLPLLEKKKKILPTETRLRLRDVRQLDD